MLALKKNTNLEIQADIFKYFYNIDKKCYVKIFNKETKKSRSYELSKLKDVKYLNKVLSNDYFKGNKDLMYSLNCFNTPMKADESNIFSLTNIAIDVDFDTKEYGVEQIIWDVKCRVGKKIPIPNMIEYGHRVRLIYTLKDDKIYKTMDSYKRVAKWLVSQFKDLNAEYQPTTSYARIIGSINSKDNSVIGAEILHYNIYDLEELIKLVPVHKKVTKKAANKKKAKVTNMFNPYTLYLARINDLEKLSNRVYEGIREKYLWIYRTTCLLSGNDPEYALERTLKLNDRLSNPLLASEVKANTKCNNFENYTKFTNIYLLDMFKIVPSEEKELNLETIISHEEYLRRKRVKYANKLKESGKISRDEKNKLIRSQILELLNKRLSQSNIAKELNISDRTVRNHIKYLKDNNKL